jgi:hypothetical protein
MWVIGSFLLVLELKGTLEQFAALLGFQGFEALEHGFGRAQELKPKMRVTPVLFRGYLVFFGFFSKESKLRSFRASLRYRPRSWDFSPSNAAMIFFSPVIPMVLLMTPSGSGFLFLALEGLGTLLRRFLGGASFMASVYLSVELRPPRRVS